MLKGGFNLSLILKGMAMGIAEIIPGVSGGTIAFITGIYERLITAISHFDKQSLGLLLKGEWKDFWRRIDGFFLLQLLFGMALGIISGALVVIKLLEKYPPVIWAFFFGLIIGSIIYVARKISSWNATKVVIFILGTILAYLVVSSPLGMGDTALWYVFISGVLAICALVLPGISGSYILLLLGMYFYIVNDTLKGLLHDFNTDKFLVLCIFGFGCLVGLKSVVKILKWAFSNYHDIVLSLLTGFMLGSLPKIWPWRNINSYLDKTDGSTHLGNPEQWLEQYKILTEINVLPAQYLGGASFLIPSVILGLFGIVSILVLAKFES